MINFKHPLLQASILTLVSFLATQTSYAEANNSSNNNSSILIQEGDISVTKEDTLKMFKDMSIGQKNLLFTDIEKFKDLLIKQLILKKKVAASKQKGLDKDPIVQWKFQRSENLILSNSLVNDFKSKISIPDDLHLLAKEYYDSHPEKFLNAERIKVSHILFRFKETDDKESKDKKLSLANTVLSELKQGMDFALAARKYSEDPGSATTGGEMNYFGRGRMVKPFEEAAFNLKKAGDISDIIETKFGYHIILLIDYHESNSTPYNKVKSELVDVQVKKYIKKKVASYNNKFNANKNTTIYLPAIQQFISETSPK